MLDFKFIKNPQTNEEWIETSLTGKLLLNIPQLNKGTAFSEEERETFGLLGKLPAHIETLDEQVNRAYLQFQAYATPIQKNIYLNNLHDKNQVLFYKLVNEHLAEMLPIIYTPTVGQAVKQHSREFRQARGLYVAYSYRDKIAEILDNRSHPEIDLIVVTDGEGILGIGDQGIGGMDIAIAKLMLYSLCAGISPLRTLPIMLDVGTDNESLLNDPLYLGARHKRIRGQEYDEFINEFVMTVKRKFPNVFLHWEDFGRGNAKRNLDLFRHKISSFNDDIQGTAVVALSALLAAIKALRTELKQQQIVILGAGTAGAGIADQICAAMVREGINKEAAQKRIWLVDRQGLLLNDFDGLTEGQKPYAHTREEIKNWILNSEGKVDLLEVVKQVKPLVLLGTSACSGAFTQEIVQELIKQHSHPIIFPLSNPPEYAEAHPRDLLQWTNGAALIATGSPFEPINYNGKVVTITQCNNALSFPGIGLGVVAAKANFVSDDMLWEACKVLSHSAPVIHNLDAPLLPSLAEAKIVAERIALAVAKQAIQENLASVSVTQDIAEIINRLTWDPHYIPLRFS